MSSRNILSAVARADLIVCTVLRWLAALIPLGIALLLIVLSVRAWLGSGEDWIDYDAPSANITSEGTENWRDDR